MIILYFHSLIFFLLSSRSSRSFLPSSLPSSPPSPLESQLVRALDQQTVKLAIVLRRAAQLSTPLSPVGSVRSSSSSSNNSISSRSNSGDNNYNNTFNANNKSHINNINTDNNDEGNQAVVMVRHLKAVIEEKENQLTANRCQIGILMQQVGECTRWVCACVWVCMLS